MEQAGVLGKKIILHIDFDSFFASVEQQYTPHLRGKPVGVTATNGRTCIIAASRQAKQYGIKSPSHTTQAKKICPELQLVSANFHKYWEVSQQFLAICNNFSPFIEVFSIDEVFMDVTKTVPLFGNVSSLIAQLKKRIATEIGEYITVSIGISHNKLLAKLASGLQKPNGVVCIRPEDVQTVYANIPLTAICGIGERIAHRLHAMGIRSLLHIQQVPQHYLVAEFGPAEAKFLKRVSFGIDPTPLACYTTVPDAKSVGRNYCLPHNEYNQRIILQNVYELSEEIGIKLRRLGKRAKTIGISLRGGRDQHGRKTLPVAVDSGKDIFTVCKQFYDMWGFATAIQGEEQMVRMISVWAGNLLDTTYQSVPLFDTMQKREKITTVVDRINEKFGDHTIRSGYVLYGDRLTTVPNGYMADRYERSKLAKKAEEQFR